MPELIAQGTQPSHRWRRTLPVNDMIELGRATPTFAVPWDNQISRRHIQLVLRGERVNVIRLPTASNPVFLNGAQEDTFWLSPGEHFVIGETTFTLTADRAEATMDMPVPVRQQTFSRDFLQNVRYRDAAGRVQVLSGLPELISSASNRADLFNRIVTTLLEGIRSAVSIGIVQLPVPDDGVEPESVPPVVLHWDRRGASGGDFHPSTRLITQAMQTQQSVLHVWEATAGKSADYTMDAENDWAFCCPIDGQATKRWGIYVTGSKNPVGIGSDRSNRSVDSGSDVVDLQGDVKFCELVGTTLKNLLLVRQLQQRQTSLGQFFSPIVLQAIGNQDPDEVLAPRECRVSVMFCDLRGFSRASERLADNLPDLLRRTSDALGIITRCIMAAGGVIGDFHGDAVMGFWGWPLKPADDQALAVQAIAAATQIQTAFQTMASDQANALHNFRVGVGIATGQAVAGKIGTRDQVKVTAFGPVVNLAARLEGMNRPLGTQVLIDGATLECLGSRSSEIGATCESALIRRFARFQPYGISTASDVYELLPESQLTQSQLKEYENALVAFESGMWDQTREQIARLPEADAGVRFLKQQTARDTPDDWAGVIRLSGK
jgi:adenylate cyclase